MIKFSKWKVPPIGGSSAPLIIYTVGDAPAWAQDRVTGKIRSLAYEAAQSHRIDRIGAGTERHLTRFIVRREYMS